MPAGRGEGGGRHRALSPCGNEWRSGRRRWGDIRPGNVHANIRMSAWVGVRMLGSKCLDVRVGYVSALRKFSGRCDDPPWVYLGRRGFSSRPRKCLAQ